MYGNYTPKRQITPEAMRLRLADLCARSEQCEWDIVIKLKRSGLRPSDCQNIIDFLKRERFIDEERFARAYARDKVKFSGWGPYKVRLGLAAKRISSSAIASAINEVNAKDYQEAAERVAATKAKSLNLNVRDDQLKLYRHLLSRGFSSEITKQVINRLRGKC